MTIGLSGRLGALAAAALLALSACTAAIPQPADKGGSQQDHAANLPPPGPISAPAQAQPAPPSAPFAAAQPGQTIQSAPLGEVNARPAEAGLLGGPPPVGPDTVIPQSLTRAPSPPPLQAEIAPAPPPAVRPTRASRPALASARPRATVPARAARPGRSAAPAARPAARVNAPARPTAPAKPTVPAKAALPKAAPVKAAPPKAAPPKAAPPKAAPLNAAPANSPPAQTPPPTASPATTRLGQAVAAQIAASSTLTAAPPAAADQPHTVTLTLPKTLLAQIQEQAAKLGLRRKARSVDAVATLSGANYQITPSGPQTAHLVAGQATQLTWAVKPLDGATGALSARIEALLKGSGAPTHIALGDIGHSFVQLAQAAGAQAKGAGESLGPLNIPGVAPIALPGGGLAPSGLVVALLLVFVLVILIVALLRANAERRREEEEG